jgi:hypothetical protein
MHTKIGFQFEQHLAIYRGNGLLEIGEVVLTIPEWRERFVELAHDNGYTPEQTYMYAQFIEGLARVLPPPEFYDELDVEAYEAGKEEET